MTLYTDGKTPATDAEIEAEAGRIRKRRQRVERGGRKPVLSKRARLDAKMRLAEIEARAVEVASRDHLKTPRISDEWIAHHARTDIPDIIAALRELQAENERLRAERLTPDDYETILGALDDEIGEERNMAQGYEDGSPRFLDHIASMERVFAVKAKIEAMRDGGEG